MTGHLTMELNEPIGTMTVQSVHFEGPDAVRVQLSPSSEDRSRWIHEPGAFITFSITPTLQRSYTLVNPIGSFPLEIVVRSIPGGKGSQFFNEVAQVGSEMHVMPPRSLLWRSEWNEEPTHFVCFAGGIGITPIFSLIQHVLRNPKLGHRITLFYSNRSRRHEIFGDLLHAWEDRIEFIPLYSEDSQLEDSQYASHMTSQRIQDWLKPFEDKEQAMYIVSAPPGLMRTVHAGLDEAQIPENRRHTERFTAAALSDSLPDLPSNPTTDRPRCTIEFERDHAVEEFEMHGEGQSILDAALDAGLSVPYSCRGGVCLSCLAHITEGEVQTEGDNGLTEKEQNEGLILCCKSQPKSEELKLRFMH